MPDEPPAHGGGRSPVPGEPIRVTVVGADPVQRDRLVEILAASGGIEVVGWDDSPEFTAEASLVVQPAAPGPARLLRPLLAPRQREVLIAYAASNEVVHVVARRLQMTKETLKTHLRRIRAKYREIGRPAPTRRDLYVRAVEDGLVDPPS